MGCDRWHEALSAIVDGEDPGVDRALVDAHLARCATCRQFRDLAVDARRLSRVRQAAPQPDLSGRIVKLIRLDDRVAAWTVVRLLLAAVAVLIVVLAVPDLVGGHVADAAHEARHVGAFSIAYAVALFVVVARPARARTVLPVASVLAGALVITATIDLVNGNIGALGEAQHLPEVLSVALIWLLALPTSRRAPPAAVRQPSLRSVGSDRGPRQLRRPG